MKKKYIYIYRWASLRGGTRGTSAEPQVNQNFQQNHESLNFSSIFISRDVHILLLDTDDMVSSFPNLLIM